MKTFIPIITLIAGLSLFGAAALSGQETSDAAVPAAVQAAVQKAQAAAQQQFEQAQQQQHLAAQQVAQAQASIEAQLAQAMTAEAQPQPDPERMACINNLRQIDGAKQQWALENHKPTNAVPTAQDLAPYLKDSVLPTCPAGGQYSLNAVGTAPTCSKPGHALRPAGWGSAGATSGVIHDERTGDTVVQRQDGSKLVLHNPGGSGSQSAPTGFRDRLVAVIGRASGGPGGVLVIRSTDPDLKTQANLDEDLAVMSRVLEKALAPKPDEATGRRVMGVNVLFTPGQSPIRSLYLDGYGALFFLNVNLPLLPPPPKAEATKEEPKVDSAWDEARRELYGQRPDWEAAGFSAGYAAELNQTSAAEAYSADKVNQLRDALLATLKDAANIRDLKPDDWVTVCVFGRASGAPIRVTAARPRVEVAPGKGTSAAPPQPARPLSGQPGTPALGDLPKWGALFNDNRAGNFQRGGTTMTLRVKKADVDAFAKGKLTLDDFRKRAKVVIYASGGESAALRPAATTKF